MTIRQLAEAAGTSARTVRRVALRLFPGLIVKGRRSEFGESEALRIMAELRKHNFVSPGQNGQEAGQNGQLTGAVLRELRLMVKERILTPSQVQRLLGVDRFQKALPPAEPVILRGEAARKLVAIRAQFQARAEADRRAEELQQELPL